MTERFLLGSELPGRFITFKPHYPHHFLPFRGLFVFLGSGFGTSRRVAVFRTAPIDKTRGSWLGAAFYRAFGSGTRRLTREKRVPISNF